MTADLFKEHRTLVAAAEELLALVRQTPPVPIEDIAQLRVRIANLALAHLRAEDEVIIRPLLASGRSHELPEASTLIAEIRSGHSVYSNHVRTWTLQAVELDREGYAEAMVDMTDYLRRMIAREENLLYWPALKLLNGARAQEAG